MRESPSRRTRSKADGARLAGAPRRSSTQCYPGSRGNTMSRSVVAVVLGLTVGCASAAPNVAPVAATRAVAPDVVDLRGIVRGTHLGPKGAGERGLDVTQVVLPRKTRNVPPVYSREARDVGIAGTVTVECIIEIAGEPRDCLLTGGPVQLRGVALHAVRGWRWQPLTVGGTPRRALVQLTLRLG